MASRSSIDFASTEVKIFAWVSELDFRKFFSISVISKYSVEPVV
jgi:hypothetical protein